MLARVGQFLHMIQSAFSIKTPILLSPSHTHPMSSSPASISYSINFKTSKFFPIITILSLHMTKPPQSASPYVLPHTSSATSNKKFFRPFHTISTPLLTLQTALDSTFSKTLYFLLLFTSFCCSFHVLHQLTNVCQFLLNLPLGSRIHLVHLCCGIPGLPWNQGHISYSFFHMDILLYN